MTEKNGTQDPDQERAAKLADPQRGKVIARPFTWVRLEGTNLEVYLSHPSSMEDVPVLWQIVDGAQEAPAAPQD